MGYSSKEKQNAYNKKWAKDNPEKYRETQYRAWIKRKYNLSPKDYNEMFENQKGCCIICGKHQTEVNRRFVVDHDHVSGKTRALLCDNCNKGLGHFKEKITSLTNAIAYLKAWE